MVDCIRHAPGVYRVCRTQRHDMPMLHETLHNAFDQAATTNRGFFFFTMPVKWR